MSKEKKTQQLGMNPSTAQGALRKEIMFHLAGKCDMLSCHRCGTEIEDSKSLSIEHKEPWLDSEDPVGLFFDLKNIAFSHLSCNAAASRGRKGKGYDTEEERLRASKASKKKWADKKCPVSGLTNRQKRYREKGH